jgi:multiple sugar transport system permease protein
MKTIFTPWFFLAPALILLGIFVIFPIIYLAFFSFTDGSFSLNNLQFVGLKNYVHIINNQDFWQVINNTIYFTIATVIPSVIIPLILAVLLNENIPFRGMLRTAFFIPSITSLVAVGLGFRWLFQNQGPVNYLLINLGFDPINWLSSTVWAMPILILLSSWKQLGFNMVVFLAGLQTIPLSRYEAAELDGANNWAKFWYITLPGLQPTLIFTFITTIIFTLRSFEQVYIITGGGPLNTTNLLVYYIYQEAFARFDFAYAAAASSLLLIITLFLVALQLKTWNQSD